MSEGIEIRWGVLFADDTEPREALDQQHAYRWVELFNDTFARRERIAGYPAQVVFRPIVPWTVIE